MRALILGLALLVACDDDRGTVPPDGSMHIVPDFDAGTGRCRDDYDLAFGYCAEIRFDHLRESACLRAAVNKHATCLGPRETCIRLCGWADPTFLDSGAVDQSVIDGCRARCPQ